jgi:hypothetical protein
MKSPFRPPFAICCCIDKVKALFKLILRVVLQVCVAKYGLYEAIEPVVKTWCQ